MRPNILTALAICSLIVAALPASSALASISVDYSDNFQLNSNIDHPATSPSDRAALNPAGATSLNPGDILVIDSDAGTDLHGAMFKIDPVTGYRRLLSDFGNEKHGPLGKDPFYLAIDTSVKVLVTEPDMSTATRGLLFSVDLGIDPASPHRTILSNFDDINQEQDPRGELLGAYPVGVAVDGASTLVLTKSGGTASRGALFRIDPSGVRTMISDFGDHTKGRISQGGLQDLAIDAEGNILASDSSIGFTDTRYPGALFIIDPSSGVRMTNLWNDSSNSQPLGCNINGLGIDTSGTILVTDDCAGKLGGGVIFQITPGIYKRTILYDFGDPMLGKPTDVAVEPSGHLLVLAKDVGTGSNRVLYHIDLSTGIRTVLNDFSDPTQGDRLGSSPEQLVIVPTTIPTQPVDLTITHVEITQGIQDLNNNVPLVEGKTTYVRVYPRVDIDNRRAKAQLRVFRDGVELTKDSPLDPIYPYVTVKTGGAQRGVLKDTFNFFIPPDWRSGTVTFQAEINLDGAVHESNINNNTFRVENVRFAPKVPICLEVIPIRTKGTLYTVNSPGYDRIIDRFKSLFPISKVIEYYQSEPIEKWKWYAPWSFSPYELPGDTGSVLLSLRLRDHFFTSGTRLCPVGARFHHVGMVSDDTETGGILGASIDEYSWVKMYQKEPVLYNMPGGGVTLAHELGHNYGRLHIQCPKPPDIPPPGPIDPDWPTTYDSCKLSTGDFWGFDTMDQFVISVIDPMNAKDLMSYGRPRWSSDYTWRALFGVIKDAQSPPNAKQETAIALTKINNSKNSEILIIGGSVTPTANKVNFEFAYRLPQNIIDPNKLPDAQFYSYEAINSMGYALELVDTQGNLLFSQPFDPEEYTETASRNLWFYLTVPFYPDTDQIHVTRNGQKLGALAISSNAPHVKILQPTKGETIVDSLTIQWEASDPDNDPLLYTVQYSSDLGVTWQVLDILTAETTLTLEDTLSLPGSDQGALIRVIANDGVNTGSAISEPFTLLSHPPVAHITNPTNHAIYPSNSQIILMGRGRDSEDGTLSDGSLQWLLDGEMMGSGSEIALDGLISGTYVITLEVVDSDNNTATASVTINVQNSPVANSDGYITNRNTPLIVESPGVLGNDLDAQGNPLVAVLVGDVTNGTLTLNADGSFTYTPNTNFKGEDNFSYKATDGTSESNIATVNLTVLGNDPPAATEDDYKIREDNSLIVDAPGVLGNDIDKDGDTLSAVLVSSVQNGTLNLNPDGSFTYAPDPGFVGSDSFIYRAYDGTAESNDTTVSLTVFSKFTIDIDAKALTNTGFTIKEYTDLLDGTVVQTLILQEGNYRFQVGPVTDFTFSVNADGKLDYDPAFDNKFLSGRGTHRLILRGYDFYFDGTQLANTQVMLRVFGEPLIDITEVRKFTLLPASGYRFLAGAAMFADFAWNVDLNGNIDYDPKYDGFVEGRGTNTLVVKGYPVTIDATRLSGPRFIIPDVFGLRDHELETSNVHTLRLLPILNGNAYRIQVGPANVATFTWGIDLNGHITYDAVYGGFLSGRGTQRLRLKGYKIYIDATALQVPEFQFFGVLDGLAFKTSDVKSLRLLPAGYRFYAPPIDVPFLLNEKGILDYECPLNSIASGRGTNMLILGSPQQRIEDLIVRVEKLVKNEVLNKGQGNSLITKLENASNDLEKGKNTRAIDRLQAVSRQIQNLANSGTLNASRGRSLTKKVNGIIDQIELLSKGCP